MVFQKAELLRKLRNVPEGWIWPVANCSSINVCSQAAISSSQAFTSDCLADERDCMTPSTRFFSWASEGASGSSRPFSGLHFQHLTTVRCSYLSSSRSSAIASLVIFAGGSSSSDYNEELASEIQLWQSTRLTRFVDGLSFRFTFKVNPWPVFDKCVRMWCLSRSRHPPVKHFRQTSIPSGWS